MSGHLETLYDDTRQRIVALLDGAGDAVLTAAVPACPIWRVRDVVGHLTGVCADVINGNLDGKTTDAWTAAQVDARRDLPFDHVVEEWAQVGPKFAAMIDEFPGFYGRQVVADITVHEQDLRGALGIPGHRDGDGLRQSLDLLIGVVMDAGANALGVGPIEVVADDRRWLVGGEPSNAADVGSAMNDAIAAGQVPAPPDRPAEITLTAPSFELFRAMTGRRSAGQIRRLGWSGDPSPYLPLFALGPFTLRTDDLDE
jgi:uncharacterized protein (TIGR03083 family)